MTRQALFLAIATCLPFSAPGAPPGAMIRTRLNVPDNLKQGDFAADRYLNIPPGFRISLVALLPGARFMAAAPNGDLLVSQPGLGQVTLLRPATNGGVPQGFTFVSGLDRKSVV